MFFDVLMWVLIVIIGFFAVVGIFTISSILFDDETQEENDENVV